MLRYAAVLAISLVGPSVWAQAPGTETPKAAEAAKAIVPMEEPHPGDRWTYEMRDDVTGKITATRENVVTEVTPTSISVRFKKIDADDADGISVYDRSWNVVESRPWRYSPNDGSGIQSPLEIGKTWPVKTNNINGTTGAVWRRSGIARVVGQETVTTKAGTFDTFKIETKFTGTNVNNPMMKNDVTQTTWYAPAIDHWVKRTFVSRANQHLNISNVFELVEYSRKQ